MGALAVLLVIFWVGVIGMESVLMRAENHENLKKQRILLFLSGILITVLLITEDHILS